MTLPLTALPDDDSGFHSIARLPSHALRRSPDVPLDGTWDFQLLREAGEGLRDEWSTAPVPGLWTMQEESDPPQYLNVAMPFPETPPTVPSDNPVGVYRRRFRAPAVEDGRLVLHVGAAEGFLRVFVNDVLVGTSNDSHLAAEFDITSAVLAGENTLVLAVSKWSAVTYLEDQDHWWQSGLPRSVFLLIRPAVHLVDVHTTADFDPVARRGSLSVTVATTGHRDPQQPDHRVRITALGGSETLEITPRSVHATINTTESARRVDRAVRPEPLIPPDIMEFFSDIPSGAPILDQWKEAADSIAATYLTRRPDPGTVEYVRADLAVEPWTAETPHLEDVRVELLDAEGRVVDSTTLAVGFRRVEVVGRDLLVNGVRILIQGVNRHDVHPRTGRVLTVEETADELAQLKRFNVNAVRTSHYPNDPVVLDLCDRFGLYVVDEADIEGHAFMDTLSADPTYLAAFGERVSRMVLRDRNHPCVISWSLGNETGYGANHDAVAAWVRRFDPTRPVQYEGAVSKDWYGGHAASDISCPMYPSVRSLQAYSADPRGDRPLILSEYAYSQGNSTGGFSRYWELFETLPGLQGGFIWEYLDHALDPEGDGRFRSGDDFGDRANDGDLMLNGIAFADRTPKPALFEAREVCAPVRIVSSFAEAQQGTLRVRNRQSFADLSALTFAVSVETTSGARALEPIEIRGTAGEEVHLRLSQGVVAELQGSGVLGMTLTAALRDDAPWAPAGTVIAEPQVAAPVAVEALAEPSRPVPTLDEHGRLTHPLLAAAPRLSLWRALIDNDSSTPLDQRFVRSGFFRLEPVEIDVRNEGPQSVVTTVYSAAFGDTVTHRQTVSVTEAGDYLFSEEVTLPEGTIDGLRVGVTFTLVDGFDQVEWVGLGPIENYPDRREAARRGVWTSAIEDLEVRYLPPQENGGRGDVTRLRVSGAPGAVSTRHAEPLQMNVARYTPDQLESAPHWWELPPSAGTVVHLDVAHRGLGTGVLGPDTAHEFRLDGDSYRWSWELSLRDRAGRSSTGR